jgi:hypothetical protein
MALTALPILIPFIFIIILILVRSTIWASEDCNIRNNTSFAGIGGAF